MSSDPKPSSSENKNVSINGDVSGVVVVGDNNVVNNQTIIQKFFNIFKSDSETLEHRNRRILLGHVENAWIKGVLDASLHGAALLDLGIKEDPEAVTQYPWAIKKESTDETLPAGTSMLEIFDNIGMGRSLLILGAPGSGKTTMLLELARQLIARAREDVTQPIPMVFNLASWTEKLTLADWLAQELNNLYSVPRKTAPDWVKGDKLLLLLDGLDEVRQESRAKCVEAINAFRKEHGLTSLAVCSRSQDYADLKTKLSFEGAIEVQPLTQRQITEFFDRFGDGMAGIKQVLEKDNALREMAETPLFLSIMIMTYRNQQDIDILVSQDEKAQRKYLFDTYIERMFERSRSKNIPFVKQDVSRWLVWIARGMNEHRNSLLVYENMKMEWLESIKLTKLHQLIVWFTFSLLASFLPFLLFYSSIIAGHSEATFFFLFSIICLITLGSIIARTRDIETVDFLTWSWRSAILGLIVGLFSGGLVIIISSRFSIFKYVDLRPVLLFITIASLINLGISSRQLDRVNKIGMRMILSLRNFFVIFTLVSPVFTLSVAVLILSLDLNLSLSFVLKLSLLVGFTMGFLIAGNNGGIYLIQHYTLRFILARNNLLPWRLVPFLDHCVDLIFLRRVGGGYIFVHRLLMEHFAEMYVEAPTSKGN